MAVMTTLSTLAATRQLLEETGVQKLVYVDFYDQIVQLVQNIIVPDEKKTVLTLDGLSNFFRDAQGKYVLEWLNQQKTLSMNRAESNMVVMYLRLVTVCKTSEHCHFVIHWFLHVGVSYPGTRRRIRVFSFPSRNEGSHVGAWFL